METLTVNEDPQTGDLYLQFSDDLLEKLGWEPGDNLAWIDNENGTWTLKKYDASTMEETESVL
jgi:hypothetical protein